MREPKNVWKPTEAELQQWLQLTAIAICNGRKTIEYVYIDGKQVLFNPKTNYFQLKDIEQVRDYYKNKYGHKIDLIYKIMSEDFKH